MKQIKHINEILNSPIFVFDVESVGLHGQAFAVAGGIYQNGIALEEFAYHCCHEYAQGTHEDSKWVQANVQIHPTSENCFGVNDICERFWKYWTLIRRKHNNIKMFVECGWPVEAHFINACIDLNRYERNWDGPYPLHEIASIMLVAGMDPLVTYERLDNELPIHEPLADSRQSARLLYTALNIIKGE